MRIIAVEASAVKGIFAKVFPLAKSHKTVIIGK
jgi:hypothetical protein